MAGRRICFLLHSTSATEPVQASFSPLPPLSLRLLQLPFRPSLPFCSTSASVNPAFDKIVAHVCSIIHREREWSSRLEAALSTAAPLFHARLLFRVLKLQNDPQKAWMLFHWVGQQPNFVHTPFTYCALIEILARAKDFRGIWFLLEAMKESGLMLTPVPFTTLINSYGSVGMVEEASKAFQAMTEFRCKPNVYAYNALLNAQLKANRIEEAWATFMDMTKNGFTPDVVTYTTLITGLCKAGKVENASILLDDMISKECAPNTWTFTAMIQGLLKAGHATHALLIYEKMQKHGCTPDAVTYNSLINWFCKEGDPAKALEFLDQMTERSCDPDITTYCTLIDGLFKAGRATAALNILKRMIDKGCNPDTVTYKTMAIWLSQEANLEDAKETLDWITSRRSHLGGFNHATLMDALVREGRADIVLSTVKRMMLKGYSPNRSICTTLINSLCKQGRTEDVVELLEKMAETSTV